MDGILVFVFGAAVILATPGPTNVLLVAAGSLYGWRRALPLVMAELAGYTLSVAVLRLAVLPHVPDTAGVRAALCVAAAAYLYWTARRLWRWQPLAVAVPVTMRTVFTTTLLNPKGLLLAAVILPRDAAVPGRWFLGLLVIVLAAGTAWVLLGALAGRAGRRTYRELVPRIAAALLAGLATVLLVLPIELTLGR